MSFTTHDEYFASCNPDARGWLMQIQQEVQRQVPDAVQCIGYSMPAFRHQRVFLYFAAFKNHVGIYPPVTDDEALITETERFRGPKGNLSFPFKHELPLDIIGRVAQALALQYSRPRTKRGSAGAAPSAVQP
jgi:uncharacterized protein YdhG (YjbR/CyaY superfamily)